ncbi:biopolymer transporter ExbD [Allopusillimonas soli]|uniref:Biopolymer transporter ExbD n=1 Tax=Allopusillimonas soli TaxID=659016 RepID=A0A853F7A5_9BURK|nr:biopolymer transporter ExbD [Allopusillimonas soli]NYT35422.1 biopolymer transporter ExbD [Allopusillimonas soli]TEA75837.1 biopolymer transporter ExbD [Allopusillimonas soli]
MAFGSFDTKAANHTVNEINMVPLIDVMLVLLVIFIITAPLISHSIRINVPQASADPVEMEPKSIDLAVDAEGILYWNDEAISPDELESRLASEATQDPQPELRIRADLNTRYEILAKIMSSAKAAGLKRMGFITRPAAKDVAHESSAGKAGSAVGGAGQGQQAGGSRGVTPAAAH